MITIKHLTQALNNTNTSSTAWTAVHWAQYWVSLRNEMRFFFTMSEVLSRRKFMALLTSSLQSWSATMHSSWFFPVTSISWEKEQKHVRCHNNSHGSEGVSILDANGHTMILLTTSKHTFYYRWLEVKKRTTIHDIADQKWAFHVSSAVKCDHVLALRPRIQDQDPYIVWKILWVPLTWLTLSSKSASFLS